MTTTFERPWSQLSIEEQRDVRRHMALCAGTSVNGVAGWYSNRRDRDSHVPTPKVGKRYTGGVVVRYDGASVPDERPDVLTLDELRDILS